MRKSFFGYVPYDESDFKVLWEKANFVVDANILLNLYRYSEDTQKIILDSLEKVSDRLWIPYNTAKEFFDNRIDVIYEQKNIYKNLKQKINLNDIIEHIKQLRHTTLSNRKEDMISLLKKCQEDLDKIISEDECKQDKSHCDIILEYILKMFEGKVGEKIDDETLKQYKKEIDDRYAKKVPPGYKDAQKNKEGRKYGDCINWFCIIDYAKRNEKDIIYITDDNKEDWFLTKNGKKVGPRMELLEEFYEKTGSRKIYIYNTNTFIENFNKFFDVKFSISKEISNEIEEISENKLKYVINNMLIDNIIKDNKINWADSMKDINQSILITNILENNEMKRFDKNKQHLELLKSIYKNIEQHNGSNKNFVKKIYTEANSIKKYANNIVKYSQNNKNIYAAMLLYEDAQNFIQEIKF